MAYHDMSPHDILSSAVLRIPGEVLGYPRLSGDRSYLYFTRAISSGDLWLVRFDEPRN